MKGLTPKQKQLFDFIEHFSEEKGYAPSFREMAEKFQISISTVSSHIDALKKKKLLRGERGTSRSLQLNKEEKKSDNLHIDGVLRVPFEEIEEISEKLSIDDTLFEKGSLCLRIEGAMFEEEGIYSGDLLLIQQDKKPKSGDSALIYISATGDLFVKILYYEEDYLLLKSCGTGVDALKIPVEHAEILGVVKSVLRVFR